MNNEVRQYLVEIVFPSGSVTRWNEVNGLGEDAVQEFSNHPVVELVAIGNRYSDILKNQTYFVATINKGYYMFGRICDTVEGSEYAKYAVIHELEEYDAEAVKERVRTVECLTQEWMQPH